MEFSLFNLDFNLHNAIDDRFAQARQIQLFQVQIDRDRAFFALWNVDAIDVQWFHRWDWKARMSIWMFLYNFCDDFW